MSIFKSAQMNGEGILDVSPSEVYELRDQLTLIDVRRFDEYTGELGHIDGATLMTLETQFAAGVKTLDPERTTVFICRSGARSTRAAGYAKALGFASVFNLQGGMIEWNEQKLPVTF